MTQFLSTLGVIPTVAPDTLQLSTWVNDLLPLPGETGVPDLVTEPAQAAVYLNGVRTTIIQGAMQRPLIRIADANIENFWELDGEISCEEETLMDDTGKVTIEINYESWIEDLLINETLIMEDINLLIDPDPLNPNWRTRWGGKITEIHLKYDERGTHTIEIIALHFREHAKRLLVAANPIFAPEIQLPKMWVLPGPCRTILALTSFINLARLFEPVLSGITNALNPAGWIDPLNLDVIENILPTGWPLQVAFVDPAFDQSRWTSIGATWTTWHETYKDLLTDSGCCMKVYTYLTTDTDSPNTELASLLEAAPQTIAEATGTDLSVIDKTMTEIAAPLRNCVMFSFEQVDGVTGPSGTAADGLIDTVAVTLDDLITPVIIDLQTGDTWDAGNVLNGETVQDASGLGETYLIEQLLDVAPAPPQVIWWDGIYNGMISTDLTYHKGAVKTIMTGSKSPSIVNEAITFAIRYGLSQLQTVITADPIFAGIGPAPVGAGLDNLYQGQLDNTLLAWERFTDPIRALYTGDMAWQEHFERGSGTAYTLASILTLRSGDWKTRAWASFQAKPLNGFPWVAEVDYFVGDRVGFEQEGVIYVDNVYGISRKWSWDGPMEVTVKIGDNKDRGDPFNAAFKTMANLYSLVGELAGEGTLFDG